MLLKNKNAAAYGAGGTVCVAVASSSSRHRVPASHPKTIQIHATD